VEGYQSINIIAGRLRNKCIYYLLPTEDRVHTRDKGIGTQKGGLVRSTAYKLNMV